MLCRDELKQVWEDLQKISCYFLFYEIALNYPLCNRIILWPCVTASPEPSSLGYSLSGRNAVMGREGGRWGDYRFNGKYWGVNFSLLDLAWCAVPWRRVRHTHGGTLGLNTTTNIYYKEKPALIKIMNH